MTVLQLFGKESVGSRKYLIGAIAMSGVANAIMVAVINAAAKTAGYDEMNFRYLLMFVAAIGLYIIGLKYTFDSMTRLFEGMSHKIRVRLLEKIGRSEVTLLDHVGKAELYKRVTQDTTIICESQGLLVAAVQSTVMVVCIGVYVLTISVAAFLTTVVLVSAGVTIFLGRKKEVERCMDESAQIEIDFIRMTNHAIEGLKELKLNQARTRDLLDDVQEISESLQKVRIRTMGMYNDTGVFAQCFFYVLVACIVFFLPWLQETYSASVTELVAVILFIIGPLSTIVKAIPTLSKANSAAASIASLEATIEGFATEFTKTERKGHPLSFAEKIEIIGLEYHYDDPTGKGFAIGPIDLTITKGKTILLAGGNGSGKTTFLKSLTTLYVPSAGRVLVDGVEIEKDDLQAYRELFSAIYTDFHLFEKLYGLGVISATEVLRWLQVLRLQNKTRFHDGKFSTLDLSTGQRKRLALIVAILEDRPIMVFDEWAAEQDPEFRQYFYEVLLTELKQRGKTLIVSTHDDRYFHLSDVLVKFEAGTIVAFEERPMAAFEHSIIGRPQ